MHEIGTRDFSTWPCGYDSALNAGFPGTGSILRFPDSSGLLASRFTRHLDLPRTVLDDTADAPC